MNIKNDLALSLPVRSLQASTTAGYLNAWHWATILMNVFALVATADCQERNNWKPPTSLTELQTIRELPNLFQFANGNEVPKTREHWQARREELKSMLLYYQYGSMPPRPDQVIPVESREQPHPSGLGKMQFLTLEIDGYNSLRFRVVCYLPKQPGQRPVIMREEGNIGHRKDVEMFLKKGYIFIEYARHDLDPDRDRVVGPAQAVYPNHDWATLSVWAWCGMRLVDYLETRDDVDMSRLAITGHSRGGKMALLTAALDERISLVVPHQSGSGGAGSYRILSPGAETLAHNDKPHWYHERLRWFWEKEDRLPFDQHSLKALIAPRALLCTESLDDEFANPLGTLATSYAAQEAFDLYDVPERNAIHFRHGRHSTEKQDWQRILEFAEWQFFGRKPKDTSIYSLSKWTEKMPLPDSVQSKRDSERNKKSADSVHTWVDPNKLALEQKDAASFVLIDEPGNKPDRNLHGQGRYGSVDNGFRIATKQVTHVEYARFLNAVAAYDANELYHPLMETAAGPIRRTGKLRHYRYEVEAYVPPQPVTFVSWPNAARYCNWLHNGKPSGAQSKTTTEDGAYKLVFADGSAANRKAGARFFLPSEDEWYKAAYFDPRSKSYQHFAPDVTDRPLITSFSDDLKTPFGIYDIGNDVWEWTESRVGELHRAVRRGSWFLGNNKQAAGHFYVNPDMHYFSIGFRIAKPVREQ